MAEFETKFSGDKINKVAFLDGLSATKLFITGSYDSQVKSR